jgi:hypothetical protein
MTPKQLLDPMPTAPDSKAPRRADRLLWLCIPIGVVAALVILILFGLSLGSALAIAFLIVCPLAVVWVLVGERGLAGWQRRR